MTKPVRWLSDMGWANIEPLLPRGRKGRRRVDDRRVISVIAHMLRIGERRRDGYVRRSSRGVYQPITEWRNLG